MQACVIPCIVPRHHDVLKVLVLNCQKISMSLHVKLTKPALSWPVRKKRTCSKDGLGHCSERAVMWRCGPHCCRPKLVLFFGCFRFLSSVSQGSVVRCAYCSMVPVDEALVDRLPRRPPSLALMTRYPFDPGCYLTRRQYVQLLLPRLSGFHGPYHSQHLTKRYEAASYSRNSFSSSSVRTSSRRLPDLAILWYF
jgi:hypothetical protein